MKRLLISVFSILSLVLMLPRCQGYSDTDDDDKCMEAYELSIIDLSNLCKDSTYLTNNGYGNYDECMDAELPHETLLYFACKKGLTDDDMQETLE